jgi:hypothetical protein
MHLLQGNGIVCIPNHEYNNLVIDVFKGDGVGGVEPHRTFRNPIYLCFQILVNTTKNKENGQDEMFHIANKKGNHEDGSLSCNFKILKVILLHLQLL